MERNTCSDNPVARKTVVPPYTHTCVPVILSATGLVQLVLKLLEPDFTILYVVPRIVSPKEKHDFLLSTCNFSAKPRLLPKHMVLAHSIAPPLFIVIIGNDERTPGFLSEGTDSTISSVH